MNVLETFAWQLLSYKEPDILIDNALELSEIVNISIDEANQMILSVLNNYHFKKSDYPTGFDRNIFSLIVHLTQPFRIPLMTTRMDWVIDQLNNYPDLKYPLESVLDYGGGGGKDSIIFSQFGCKVIYSDFVSTLTPYVQKRFSIRGIDIPIVDVRDLEEARFDVINCMDVIEHAYDVEYVTADIVARLKQGGHLVCWPAFFNSWNGDHIEKNCGYLPYFIHMLQQVGIEFCGSSDGVIHLVRERPEEGSIKAEREIIRKELYKMSKSLSWQAAVNGIRKLPMGLLKSFIFNENCFDQCFQEEKIETQISTIIDNLAIWRLSTHRLSELQ
ncbi:MAG: methyltransferase domain-containing protein [Calothrix sp. MO_167.B42]|nr:methyltransferase domain-containing protein [Calothrix sp. MO_167.B42]